MNRGAVLACGAVGAIALASVAAGPPHAGLLVNESASVPRGLYRRTAEPIAPGRLVAVVPPPAARAYLATLGAGPHARLLKRVVASSGDVVCARDGELAWPGGRARARTVDRQGRALPVWRGCRRLDPGEVLVAGDTSTSFDSRYFGPVRTTEIEGVYREVWRW